MTDVANTIEAGKAAWGRLRKGASYDDWVAVGRALLVGRGICMTIARSNAPAGSRYNKGHGRLS